ncbi:MAG: hypothetical protein BMS9Abin37_1019 [Acidobacteriota bacterium]|nr:MAG: hypothetical protein BMS9Abin37_1019 [Acidobacteriota bacterium]
MSKEELKSLARLSDDALLRRLSDVLAQSRRVESVLVAHIAEVDARRLYAREASPSMFQYCVDVLHLSKAEAYLRIAAARASRAHPVLLPMLEDGRLHLSGISVLAPQLTKANCDELLTRAIHKTKDAIKKLVAEIAPKPDVPSVIRKLPSRQAPASAKASARPRRSSESGGGKTAPQTSNEPRSDRTAPDSVRQNCQAAPPAPAQGAPEKPAVVEPLAPARFRVQFTASAEFRDKIDRLSALVPGVDLAAIMEAAVTEKLDRLEAKRFGKTKKPRKSLEEADTSPGVRGISAPVRRFVWERDQGQCTYETKDGRRCPAREGLEFDHDEPYGVGGDRSAKNIRLRCTTHNLYTAELYYGKDKMDRYRRSADRVREPQSTLQLCPGRVGTGSSRWLRERLSRLSPFGSSNDRLRSSLAANIFDPTSNIGFVPVVSRAHRGLARWMVPDKVRRTEILEALLGETS